jgi:2-polyprenyl-3-methyl-5-hydroxy-6-metoxy-1,4-benzoquinol methylase
LAALALNPLQRQTELTGVMSAEQIPTERRSPPIKQLQDFFSEMERQVCRTISPRDEMYMFARSKLPTEEATRTYYFDTGKELASGILRYLLATGLDPEKLDFLDFAAGYGRVTRWLLPTYRTVTVADLDQEMIDFHKREFGVQGFLSSTDPRILSSHRHDYDIIFVFSLFTHLPDTAWDAWLRALASLVRPGGHLIFSTHSYELFAQLEPARFGDPATWVEEFVFWEDNETHGRLETSIYGCNIVKHSYVANAVNALPGFELGCRYKGGEFDRYHDMYVIRRQRPASISSAQRR